MNKELLQLVKDKMSAVTYPKKSPNEDNTDYCNRRRGFKLAKSKIITIYCNHFLRNKHEQKTTRHRHLWK